MPLTRYLIGAFKTTWYGAASESPERRRLELDAAERYLDAIRARVPVTFDDETRPAFTAVAMSAESFGDVVACAGPELTRVRALGDVFLWLPVAFDGLLEVADPFDDETVISAGSAPGLCDELTRLEESLGRDSRRAELEALPQGSIVTGRLAEFQNRRLVIGTLRQLVAQAVEHGVPMIVEG
jgi:hypothetical protein